MRTLIISLNSKFIHSALAPWYLKAACGHYSQDCGEVLVCEHTINEKTDSILSSIYLMKPDIVAFSCYIWNISQVMELAANLKKLLPSLITILGGPEVSYDASQALKANSFIDYIIRGEGEVAFPSLISLLRVKKRSQGEEGISDLEELATTDGLVYRLGSEIVEKEPAVIRDLDSIPSAYTHEMISYLKHKIVYFESSRGCPFSCSYCLSSVNKGVRNFSMQRVYNDLDRLIRSGVGQIKFVDRTFNANPERSKDIMRHILEINERLGDGDSVVCNFHFEVGADLFDDETIELLNNAPKGLFQLEAGVQSTNSEALTAVCRKTDLNKLFSNIEKIRKRGNVHIHADLIAGLPFEDYKSFGVSFGQVYSAKPHQLQLGFLKLLRGTRLREQSGHYGYVFRESAPYEILAGSWISHDDLIKLKGIAELVERYYNSGRFAFSLAFLINRHFDSPFTFYESFYQYYRDNGYIDIQLALRDQYKVISSFYTNHISTTEAAEKPVGDPEAAHEDDLIFNELLRLDFLASDSSGTLPDYMEKRGSSELKNSYYDFLRDQAQMSQIIPEARGMLPKQIIKRVHFEPIYLDLIRAKDAGEISLKSFSLTRETNIFMFSYFSRDKVTGRYQFFSLGT